MTLSDVVPSQAMPSSLTSAHLGCLHEVTASLALTQTSEEVADVIVSHVGPVLHTDMCNLVLLCDDGQSLRMVRAVGFAPEDVEGWQQFPIDLPVPLAEAVRSKEPVYVATSAEMQQRYPRLADAVFTAPYTSLLTLPLLVGTKALGAIGLAFPAPRSFTSDEIAFLQIVAQQCAATLERVRLLEQEQVARLALQESERRFRFVVQSIPHFVWSARADGYTDYWNPQFLNYLGTTLEEIKGWNWVTTLHPEDYDRSVAAWTEAFNKGQEYRIEYRIRRAADGEYRWFEGHALPLRDEQGAIVRWYGTCTDIHERKVAEEQVQAGEERLDAALRAGDMGAWDWNMVTGHIVWEGEHERLLGLAPGEFDGTYEGFERCVHPEDRAGIRAAVAVGAQSHTPYRQEHRVVWPDGSIHWIEGAGEVSYDAAGQPVRMVGTVRNIDARKQAEEQMRKLQDMLQAILANAPNVMWVKDTQGRHLLVNPQTAKLIGLPEQEIIGKTFEEMGIPPESAQIMREQDEMVLLTGQSHQFEYTVTFRDAPLTLLSSKFPLFAPDGSIYALGGIVLDITERKKLEKQYLQAQKMEGLGRLAGGIAHDFNNLLSVILGYAEMVEDELADDSPMCQSVHNIETAATRAATLTQQLLAFARRQTTDPKVFTPNDMLRNMGQMLCPLIGEHIELAMRLQPDLGCVNADPNQIEQVIVNLVVNARDAMPHGGTLLLQTDNVTLEDLLWHAVTVIPGEYVMLSVTDTGQGMSEEAKAHLFEPFFSTKGVGKGTGLGMATCYGIVKQHRGYIWVCSQEGIGTTVKVYLPRADAQATDTEKEDALTEVPRGTETVLVVEDEEMLRDLAAHTLRANGYTVLEAQDGVAALRVATEHPGAIHLLLSDMIMPNMGGTELAQWLREVRTETRVLFVSGYSEEAFSTQGMLPSDLPLLSKPFTTRALLTKIREVLAS